MVAVPFKFIAVYLIVYLNYWLISIFKLLFFHAHHLKKVIVSRTEACTCLNKCKKDAIHR